MGAGVRTQGGRAGRLGTRVADLGRSQTDTSPVGRTSLRRRSRVGDPPSVLLFLFWTCPGDTDFLRSSGVSLGAVSSRGVRDSGCAAATGSLTGSRTSSTTSSRRTLSLSSDNAVGLGPSLP